METQRNITEAEALAAWLAGDLLTVQQICRNEDRWDVFEEDFLGAYPRDTGAFLLSGLPCRILDFGGYRHVMINPDEFESFMASRCGSDSWPGEL